VKTTQVLDLGNILPGDDGVRAHTVERLQLPCHFPGELHVLDGGTLGLDLLPYVEDADR
jgi:hydrogenase maturation protease